MGLLSEICETINEYNDAMENLNRIREEYKNEKDLLNFYEPSAIHLVEKLKEHLESLKGECK